MPTHLWTGIGAYPCSKLLNFNNYVYKTKDNVVIAFIVGGLMIIANVTFGFYNDICSRRDIAIQTSQSNDDGQHPVTTSQISVYNTSSSNLVFNGRPNLGRVNPSDCVGKMNLI